MRRKVSKRGFPVSVISDNKTFSVHTYFDICPESPDGRLVAYTRFTGGVPGRNRDEPRAGVVVIIDRNGENERVVGEFSSRWGHFGAYVLWIDGSTIAYQDGEEVHFANIDTGEEKVFTGGCQMYHSSGGAVFTPGESVTFGSGPFEDALYILDIETGNVRPVITLNDLAKAEWLRDEPERENWDLHHAKWSPSGKRVAALVRVLGEKQYEKIMHVFSCRPDGSDIVHFAYVKDGMNNKPMHWHFYDDESIYGYDVADPERPCRRWALDGTPIEILHEGEGNHACISSDRSYFVTDSWYRRDPVRLMFYRRGWREPAVLAEMPAFHAAEVHPALSRDGRRVYFNHLGVGGQGSQVCAIDIGELVEGDSCLKY